MNTENTIQINSEEDIKWFFALIYLLLEAEREHDEAWKKFEDDLLYKNRFFSDSPIIKELYDHKELATKVIPANTIFYRARVFDQSIYDKALKFYMKKNKLTKAVIDQALQKMTDTEKSFGLWTHLVSENIPNMSPEMNILNLNSQKWQKRVRFKGYDAKASTAPPPERIGNGRANPDHIRYLYVCEDKTTPVYEVRPVIGANVSVAKLRLQKEIRIFDFTVSAQEKNNPSGGQLPDLFSTIGKMFSKPFNGDFTSYLPTQYLAEEIKRLGFDGLRFSSSLHQGGINIVLFDPEICIPISSELVAVTGITVSTEDPYAVPKENNPSIL
jgi:hypothetical protein